MWTLLVGLAPDGLALEMTIANHLRAQDSHIEGEADQDHDQFRAPRQPGLQPHDDGECRPAYEHHQEHDADGDHQDKKNREAVLYMQSANRIRRYFTELDPGSVAYLTLPTTDDFAGLFGSHRPRSSFGAMTQMPAASMATLVAPVDAFVTAAVVGTAYLLIAGASQWGAVVAAGIALAISIVAYEGWAYRDLQKMRQSLDIRFPTRTNQ